MGHHGAHEHAPVHPDRGELMGSESAAPPGTWARTVATVLLGNKTGLERLGELRMRLFACLGAALACGVAAWFLYTPILDVLTIPLRHIPGSGQIASRGKLVFLTPTEAFSTRVRVVAYTGTFLASPVIVWQVWRFFAGNRSSRGARFTLAVVTASLLLFAMGAVAAFLFVYPALKIFLYLGGPHVLLVPRADEYVSFLLLLVVAFGLTFEYPLFLLALIMAGVIGSDLLRKRRRLAYFLVILASAIVTPTVDPLTPLALAVPLGLLYEATILTARALKR
jgi:sec-independent protein translocase protein TatC